MGIPTKMSFGQACFDRIAMGIGVGALVADVAAAAVRYPFQCAAQALGKDIPEAPSLLVKLVGFDHE